MDPLGDGVRAARDQLARSGPEGVPGWLMSIGIASWMFLGAAGAVVLIAAFIGASSSISIPLILALVIGMISYPLVERMVRRRLPRAAAAAIVIALLVVIMIGVTWVTVAGVISEWPEIQGQVQSGLSQIAAWLSDAGFNVENLKNVLQQASSSGATGGLASSLGHTLASGLSGISALIFGIFIAGLLLYYVLTDFDNIASWIGSHLGVPVDVGAGIVNDAVGALRGYFRATTVTGFVVALVIGVAMLVMGIPLAVPVMLVTFLTCYIPFLGAFISGTFAFLIALASGGIATALAVLAVVLIAQNLIQTVVNTKVMGSSLNLSPIVVLVATMLGGTFGGLLGAALGAPIAALSLSVLKRLSAVHAVAPSEAPVDSAVPSIAD